jgi:hypothetical protein
MRLNRLLVVNNKVHLFTTKWHRRQLGAVLMETERSALRADLRNLRTDTLLHALARRRGRRHRSGDCLTDASGIIQPNATTL